LFDFDVDFRIVQSGDGLDAFEDEGPVDIGDIFKTGIKFVG